MRETVSFTLNGRPASVTTDSDRVLLWVLRTDLGLTGTKFGCGEGLCGACTVVVDGEAVRSCTLPIKNVKGRTVLTIEGLSPDGRPGPLPAAFADRSVAQCGYCTPGMIMTAYALLARNPKPTRDDVVKALDDNLCRCGTHNRVIDAVLAAAGSKGVKP